MSARARILVVLLAAATSAQAGSVFLLDGTYVEGDLFLDNGITVRGAATTKHSMSSVLRATFAEGAGDQFQPGLVLVGGIRIAGNFSSLAETHVKTEKPAITVPGSEIAWAVYSPFPHTLATHIPAGKTGALLPNGDFVEGTPKGGDANIAKLVNPIVGPRTFDGRKKELHALVLRDRKPAAAPYEVTTTSGSNLQALDVAARDNTGVQLRHPLYDGLKIETGELAEIRAGMARMFALDELKPSRIDGAPAGATGYSCGQALDGTPLMLNGKRIRGFESATGVAITWETPAPLSAAMARVGAGTSVPAGTKVSFAMYADGRPLARSQALGAGEAPVLLRAVVPAGTRQLSLRVEGPGGTGVWADAVLLRR